MKKKLMIALGVLGFVLVIALTVATADSTRISPYYYQIVGVSILLIVVLISSFVMSIYRLWNDNKNIVFGSSLSSKLVGINIIMSVLPVLVVFGISVSFITYSINSWYSDVAQRGLSRSLQLSKTSTDFYLENVVIRAMDLRKRLQENFSATKNLSMSIALLPQRKNFDQIGVYVATMSDPVETETTDSRLTWPKVGNDVLESFRKVDVNSYYARNVSLKSDELYSQVWIPFGVSEGPWAGKPLLLYVGKKLPDKLAKDAIFIENTSQKYNELAYMQNSMQTYYILTLILVTLIAMLFSLSAGVYYARKLIDPIKVLSDSARRIAQGDFSLQQDNLSKRNDELGHLAVRFREMTQSLNNAQKRNEQLVKMQEEARIHQERVLNSITTGVLTFDNDGVLKTFNTSSSTILDFQLFPLIGTQWNEWSKKGNQERLLHAFINEVVQKSSEKNPLQYEYGGTDRIKILLGRFAMLPNGTGMVVVFDDVTQLVSAQKEAAWGEVAKRLAHEIKNPLTPIQLSAERLQRKIEPKLEEDDAQILSRCSTTIIQQVNSLKEMVESFRNYAKSVSLKLERMDFNIIAGDVLLLYEGTSCVFEFHPSEEPLIVDIDVTAIRQVLHNLFKNASEAAVEGQSADSMKEYAKPLVTVSTSKEDHKMVLLVENNGKSFAPHIIKQAFEPYVTDKVNGTGLGLSVVKKIVEEHNGEITLGNLARDEGAWVKVVLNLAEGKIAKFMK